MNNFINTDVKMQTTVREIILKNLIVLLLLTTYVYPTLKKLLIFINNIFLEINFICKLMYL